MLADVEAYGHQFPAYSADPIVETIRAVDLMATDPDFAERYLTFLRNMVYGGEADFCTALSTTAEFAGLL